MNTNNKQWLTLKDAGIKLFDCLHSTPNEENEGFPYISIPEMKDGFLNFEDARKISSDDFSKWTNQVTPKIHDVVVSRRTNPGVNAPVVCDTKFALGQNLVILRADGTKVMEEFLQILLNSDHWHNQVFSYINTGAVFDSLTCFDIQNRIKLPIPPLSMQKKILKEIWPISRLRLSIHPSTIEARNLITKIFNELFTPNNMTPNGKLGDIIKLVSSGIEPYDDYKLYYDTSCVKEILLRKPGNRVTYEERPSRANMQPITNSIWYSKLEGQLKILAMTELDIEIISNSIFSTGFFGIVPKKEIYFEFIFFLMCSDFFSNRHYAYSSGAVMPGLNNKSLLEIPIYIPEQKSIEEFSNIARPYLKLISAYRNLQTLIDNYDKTKTRFLTCDL